MSEQDVVTAGSELDDHSARRANPVDAHVGTRVRLRRMILGMSQEKLGERLHLTFQQVQKYEKGVNRIGAGRLFDMARVLGVPVQYFYEDIPAAGAPKDGFAGMAEEGVDGAVFEFIGSREGLELNKAFARIGDPRVRRAVVELVRSLAIGDGRSAAVQTEHTAEPLP